MVEKNKKDIFWQIQYGFEECRENLKSYEVWLHETGFLELNKYK
jgi:hypothetical protein